MNYELIIDSYIKWIRDNTKIKTITEGSLCNITSPFLDRHNDHIEIYVKKSGNEYILTDDGNTLSDLTMSGLYINTEKRLKILNVTLNGFGIKRSDTGELFVEATLNNIGKKKHYLLQAILAVNDLYTLSQESVYSMFKEDVELFFKRKEVIYTKDIKIAGKAGFDHNIDFLISAVRNKPEQLIKVINAPKKDTISSAIFSFTDIAEIREEKTKNYVIYNDVDQVVSTEIIDALSKYEIQALAWSRKEQFVNEFVSV